MKRGVKSNISYKSKALSTSIKEGSAAAVTSGLGDSFITPFAVDALKASSLQIGILSSLVSILSPLAQFTGSKLMLNNSRKKIVVKYVLVQALLWLPLVVLGILSFLDLLSSYLMFALIAVYSLISIFGGLHYPAWFSWMGDLVDKDKRGSYFSKRNIALGIVGLAAAIIGSIILKYFRTRGYLELAFAIIFFIAFVFRIVSYLYLKKQYEPKLKINNKNYFSFFQFVKRYDNFGKFAVYQSVFNFAIMIASPFFAVYMIKGLGLQSNYIVFTIITLSTTVFYLIFSPLAGKFSDKYGNLKLLYIANALFIISPLPWIFIKSPILLIFVPNLISGIANAAFVISFSNFTYDSVSPEKRGICTAYLNILVGIGGFVGSLLGGLMLNFIDFNLNTFFIVFGLASFARLVTALIFLPQLKEVKRVKKVPSLHVSLMHPIQSVQSEIHWIKTFFK